MRLHLDKCLVCKKKGMLDTQQKIMLHVEQNSEIHVEYFMVTCYNCQTRCLFPIGMFNTKQLMVIFSTEEPVSGYVN